MDQWMDGEQSRQQLFFAQSPLCQLQDLVIFCPFIFEGEAYYHFKNFYEEFSKTSIIFTSLNTFSPLLLPHCCLFQCVTVINSATNRKVYQIISVFVAHAGRSNITSTHQNTAVQDHYGQKQKYGFIITYQL